MVLVAGCRFPFACGSGELARLSPVSVTPFSRELARLSPVSVLVGELFLSSGY
ncbi:MAG: hypothetical protein IH591_10205 [Bacteroidales bacterium]|nr:hypothetical protein [Bacteroidales bacterium]